MLAREQSDPNGPVESRTVTDVEKHTVGSLRILQIQQADGTMETIKTTDGHPFWVKDVGWVPAGQLEVGEQFLSADGKLVTLRDTTAEEHPEGIRVYNLTVDGDHTFFVTDASTDQAVWVHNTDAPWNADRPANVSQGANFNTNAPAAPVALNTAACFAAGTQVLLADGSTKAIEQIQPGDLVQAVYDADPEGPARTRQVQQVHHNPPARLLSVTVAGKTIRGTFRHPFYVKGRGWTAAETLASGDELRTPAGQWVKVESVRDSGVSEPVFNLQVESDRTYFVNFGGGIAVLVHNLYKAPVAAPPAAPPMQVGGVQPGSGAAIGGMFVFLAHDSLYDNWNWYRNQVDAANQWGLDQERKISDYWDGTDEIIATIDKERAAIAVMQGDAARRRLAELQAAQPQPATGGVGQEPPAHPKAPAPGRDDRPNQHHRFPQQKDLKKWFKQPPRNIDVDKYLRTLSESEHIGDPDALHRLKIDEDKYVDAWKNFMVNNPGATYDQCVEKLKELEGKFGLPWIPLQ